jgi:predicted alpha/beta-fold hydrolase
VISGGFGENCDTYLILIGALSAMTPVQTSYSAPRWLPGGHVQTIYAVLAAPRPAVAYRRERWDTPDGDFIDLDWLADPHATAQSPLVVLFHGLEGSSRSHYALALMSALHRAAWRGVVVHFRGCSGEPNRLPRAYHSGDSTEIDWILRRFKRLCPSAPLHAVGVSLGGNALLKWLGEQHASATEIVQAAASVSAPMDLMAAGDALGSGFNLYYARHFLSTMKRKSLAKLDHFPNLFDRELVMAARTLREFDDLVTAPLHTYRNTDDYWTRASSKPLLQHIAVPTLIINARNDPFLPQPALPQTHEVAAVVTLEYPVGGGHAGFVSGAYPGHHYWLPQRMLKFIAAC